MELELKHLAHYLPYELKGVYNLKDWQYRDGLEFDRVDLTPDVSVFNWFLKKSYIPLLRPLSDLTREINHNGKTFIPILELFKISISEDVQDYKINTLIDANGLFYCGIRVLDLDDEFKILSFSESHGFATQFCGMEDVKEKRITELTHNQNELWDKLNEWHFDKFGLIKAGLAIVKY